MAPESEEASKLQSPSEPAPATPPELIAIVVDDEPANCDFLVRLIQQAKFKVYGAQSAQDALRLSDNSVPPTLIIVDSELPDMSGIELIRHFREKYPAAKIVMATMHDDQSHIDRAFQNGCNAFLVKPHGFMELFRRLQMLSVNPAILDKLIINRYGVSISRG